MRYCDRIQTIKADNADNALFLGTALHTGIEKGVEADRLTTQSFSYDKPIADNTTAKGRAKNRRVEFEVTFK